MAQRDQDLHHFKTDIQNHLDKYLTEGDTWYLIAINWFEQCMKFIESKTESNPGPIDNIDLLMDEESDDIRDHMIKDIDFKQVPTEAWNMLVERFTIKIGQKPIARKVVNKICVGLEVEMDQRKLSLTEFSNQEKIVKKNFTMTETVGAIEIFMRKEFNIDSETKTRLYTKYKQLDKREITISEERLLYMDLIIIEQMNEDGTWPRQRGCKRKAAKSKGTSQGSSAQDGQFLQASRYDYSNMEPASISADNVKGEIIQKLITNIDDLNNKRMNLDVLETSERESLEKKFIADKKYLEEKFKADKQSLEKNFIADQKSLAEKQSATRATIDDSVKKLSKTLNKINEVEENVELKKEMECPVCFDQMKPPTRIFQCTSGHLICEGCKIKMKAVKCPTCEEAKIMGRATAMEQLARALYIKNNV